MKLKKNDIEGIAKKLYRDLHGKEFIQIPVNENEFIKIVCDTLEKNMLEEVNLEESVKKMLEAYEPQFRSGELDYHKMFELTKKQLAKQRKKIDIIISSDITRAKETAKITADILGVKKIIFDKRIREIFLGELDGQPHGAYRKFTYEQSFC